MSRLTIAAAQIPVSADVDRNFRKITEYLRLAAEAGAGLAAFPECALSGYGPLHYGRPGDMDHKLIARRLADLKKEVRSCGIAAVIGTSVVRTGGVYNSAVWVRSDGRQAAVFDKMHLMPDDGRFYRQGGSLPVVSLNRIRAGMQVCFDFRFPEPWRALAAKGVKLVVHIANGCGVAGAEWKVPVWEAHLRSRAAENGYFILSANAAGPCQMGVSQITGPDGLILARAGKDTEELITARIDPARADRAFYKQRRKDLFG